jgi:hypothetical protein
LLVPQATIDTGIAIDDRFRASKTKKQSGFSSVSVPENYLTIFNR